MLSLGLRGGVRTAHLPQNQQLMTIKEVTCNNCNKKFSIELRKYNEYIKNNNYIVLLKNCCLCSSVGRVRD